MLICLHPRCLIWKVLICRALGAHTGRVQMVGLEQTQDTGCPGAGNPKLEVCSPSQSVRYITLVPPAWGWGPCPRAGPLAGGWETLLSRKSPIAPRFFAGLRHESHKQFHWYNRGTMSYTRRQRGCRQVAEGGEGYGNIINHLYHPRNCLYKLHMWRSVFVYFLKD